MSEQGDLMAKVLGDVQPVSNDHPVAQETFEAVKAALEARAAGEPYGELLTAPEMRSSSLMVNVDYLELLDRLGDEETWIVLGKLKDLLG